MWQRIQLVLLVGMVGTVACIGYFITAANARLQPDSYRAAVERRLDQAQFSYRKVEVTDGCAPTYQLCRTYAGQVRVLTEATTLNGRIDCRRRWTSCTLSIPGTGLRAVALPNVVDSLPHTLDEVWEHLQDWFYRVTSSASPATGVVSYGRRQTYHPPSPISHPPR
jgi:hypothetical protein